MIVTFLAEKFNLILTTDEVQGVTDIVTEGLNLIGTAVFLGGYSFYHKLFNKRLAPADTAATTVTPMGVKSH